MQRRLINFVLNLIFFLSISLTGIAGIAIKNRANKIPLLPAGAWRGVLTRADGQPVVFNFEIKNEGGKKVMFVVNGSDCLKVDNIRQQNDSVWIDMPFFDSHFALKIFNNNTLRGSWTKINGSRQYTMAFHAEYNVYSRFPVAKPPVFDISGRWSVHFKDADKSTESVGEFHQSGSAVTGTFLTTTGDYRYLQGVISGDTLKLSTFDGGHAYYFTSLITGKDKMNSGFYYSGAASVETWVAEKNKDAKLPDEFSLTHLKDSLYNTLQFSFPDLQGRMISLHDPAFKNKVVIIQILGSWCPNCLDETRFLAPWYVKNKSRGVEVVGLAYERTASYNDAKKSLEPFMNRLQVGYPVLLTGVAVDDSLRTQKTLPEIQKIIGFPTTIFIDKKGTVRKIHTGFNGPGTGEHYIVFKDEFNSLVDQLLAE